MKTLLAAVMIGIGGAGLNLASAQEKPAAGGKPVAEGKEAAEGVKFETTVKQEAERRLEERQRAVKALEKPGVTYSGFLMDVRRAESKKKFFSLRQPVDPKSDYKNILYEDRSPRARGYLFFSIDF